jgi:hypothetical protein
MLYLRSVSAYSPQIRHQIWVCWAFAFFGSDWCFSTSTSVMVSIESDNLWIYVPQTLYVVIWNSVSLCVNEHVAMQDCILIYVRRLLYLELVGVGHCFAWQVTRPLRRQMLYIRCSDEHIKVRVFPFMYIFHTFNELSKCNKNNYHWIINVAKMGRVTCHAKQWPTPTSRDCKCRDDRDAIRLRVAKVWLQEGGTIINTDIIQPRCRGFKSLDVGGWEIKWSML